MFKYGSLCGTLSFKPEQPPTCFGLPPMALPWRVSFRLGSNRSLPNKTILEWVVPFLFQDTVVALHALSKYGATTFTRTKKDVQVVINSPNLFSTKFQVNNDNQLLLQTVKLPTVPEDYTAKVTGKGCVYLQVRLGPKRRVPEMVLPVKS